MVVTSATSTKPSTLTYQQSIFPFPLDPYNLPRPQPPHPTPFPPSHAVFFIHQTHLYTIFHHKQTALTIHSHRNTLREVLQTISTKYNEVATATTPCPKEVEWAPREGVMDPSEAPAGPKEVMQADNEATPQGHRQVLKGHILFL